MKRRSFIRSVATISLGVPLGASTLAEAAATNATAATSLPRGSFAVDANRVRFFSGAVATPLNVPGIFAGHTHRQSLDVVNCIPQFVTAANATGAFMNVEFLPPA